MTRTNREVYLIFYVDAALASLTAAAKEQEHENTHTHTHTQASKQTQTHTSKHTHAHTSAIVVLKGTNTHASRARVFLNRGFIVVDFPTPCSAPCPNSLPESNALLL